MQAPVESHPVFTGLTRPAMYAGVTIPFLVGEGAASLWVFVLTSSFVYAGILVGVMHAIGYICCWKDPRLLHMVGGTIRAHAGKNAVRNTHYWGCASYDPC